MKNYLVFFAVLVCIMSSCTRETGLPGEPKSIDSIAITNKINAIVVGKQHQFAASFFPWDAEGFNKYTWQTSNNTIATIDQNGLFSAIEEGEVTVKLTSIVPVKKGTVELHDEVRITVVPIEIESIQLNKSSLEMMNYSEAVLSVSILPADAKSKEIIWTSSDDVIATVSNGVVTAKKAGNTVITAQVKDTNIKATCNVKVNPIVVTSMQFESTVIDSLEIGLTRETKLIFTPENAENKNVTYQSSNPLVVTVDANGVVKGVSNGTNGPAQATITATSVATGAKATCTVKVYAVPDLIAITIDEKVAITTSVLGVSGYIKPTLHNRSSKPINVVRFRVMSGGDYDDTVLINSTLDKYTSYTLDELYQFNKHKSPEAVFTYEFEGKRYDKRVPVQ